MSEQENKANALQYVQDLEMMLRAAKRDLNDKGCVRLATIASLKFDINQLELFNNSINKEYLKEVLN